MRGAIVSYPKDPVGRSIRFLAHDEINQISEAVDTRTAPAQPKNFGLSNIPCRHVSQRPHSFIFMLNTTVMSSRWSRCIFQSAPSLNAGFFIRGNNKIIAAQRFSFPVSMVQIKDSCGFLFKIWISGPNPTAVTPRPNSIFTQPAPDRFSADGSDNPLFFGISGDFIVSESGEGKSEILGQLAGERLYGYNNFRGKKRRASRGVAFPEGQPAAGQRSVCAILRQSVEVNQVAGRFACLKSLRRQGGQFWHA